jgi:hypothetical protein
MSAFRRSTGALYEYADEKAGCPQNDDTGNDQRYFGGDNDAHYFGDNIDDAHVGSGPERIISKALGLLVIRQGYLCTQSGLTVWS